MDTMTTVSKSNGKAGKFDGISMLRTDSSLYLDPKFAESIEQFDAGRNDVKAAQRSTASRMTNK